MKAFTGTVRLARLVVRRDRIQLPIWIVALTLVQFASTASVVELYADTKERLTFTTASAESPVLLVFNGLISGSSLGAVAASQTLIIVAVGAAFMSTLAVVRHTRQNEETGRAEMIGSAIVGRHASLTAALLVVTGANLLLGLLNALALIGNDLPVAGAFAEGAGVASTGIAFAAIAAVFAQVTDSASAANGMSAAAVAVAFLLRAAGDVAGDVVDSGTKVVSAWPSWLSPLGWTQQIRPFDDDRWWVLGLSVAFAVVTTSGAFLLTTRRDVGFGLIPTSPGPANASPRLLSPLGLAWRLQRNALIGWSAGLLVVALALGAVGNAVDDIVESSDAVANLVTDLGGGGNLVDSYFATIFGMIGIASAGYAVQALLRLRSEETGALEPVLATAVSRFRWMASHITIAMLGTVFLLALTGAATGVVYSLVADASPDYIGELTVAACVQAPAALTLAGFVIAVFGLLPRQTVSLAWSGFALCLLLGQVGELLELPQSVLNISPFSHIPSAPVADLSGPGLAVLLALAALLTTAGFGLFRRRSLAL